MKKIFLISFLGCLLFFPLISLAGDYKIGEKTIHYEGLVPCGKDAAALKPGESPEVANPCQFCHFFVMINGIVKFIMSVLVPAVAVLMLVIGGILFFFAGAKPDILNQAKGIITSVFIGLLIIFCAWIVVNYIFNSLEIINMPTGWKWYQIGCPVQ